MSVCKMESKQYMYHSLDLTNKWFFFFLFIRSLFPFSSTSLLFIKRCISCLCLCGPLPSSRPCIMRQTMVVSADTEKACWRQEDANTTQPQAVLSLELLSLIPQLPFLFFISDVSLPQSILLDLSLTWALPKMPPRSFNQLHQCI